MKEKQIYMEKEGRGRERGCREPRGKKRYIFNSHRKMRPWREIDLLRGKRFSEEAMKKWGETGPVIYSEKAAG